VFPAIFYSRLLSIPLGKWVSCLLILISKHLFQMLTDLNVSLFLVMSYHTNLPLYVRNYFTRTSWLEHLVWWLIRFAHYFADLTLVTSPQMQEQLEEHGICRVEVWRKGINTTKFHPRFRDTEMRNKMSQGNPQDFVILYVGRLAAEKRVMDLLPIMKAASPKHTRLCIVGTGPQEAELEESFQDTNTVFMGVLHGEQLSMAFASADVLILPSDSETLGFVVLESMASGVPVIGANAGGIPHLVNNGVTSFLVTPGNTIEYMERIEQLRHDKEFRMNMGRLARAEAEQWSWESSMDYLRNIQYKQATENFQKRWFCWNRRNSKTKDE